MDLLNEISKKNLVRESPKIKFKKDKICDACQFEKQTKVSFKFKNCISIPRPLELLYRDLFSSTHVVSLGSKKIFFCDC